MLGVDISHAALNKAREFASQAGVEAQFLPMNVLYLQGIEAKTFDSALNMGCLHMITDSEERRCHLQNVHRVLKDGGIFILDHCEQHWGKGFYSIPASRYRPEDLVVGNIIDRRIRTAYGATDIPLEVIPYVEKRASELCEEIGASGFTEISRFSNNNEAFGESVLMVFQKIDPNYKPKPTRIRKKKLKLDV